MRSPLTFCKKTIPAWRRREKGDVLLEALFGVLLTAVLGAGMAHLANRMLSEKADMKIMGTAIVQMRNLLQQQGESLCAAGSTSIAVATRTVPIQVTCTTGPVRQVSSAAGSISVQEPRRIVLKARPADLGIRGGSDLEVGNNQ